MRTIITIAALIGLIASAEAKGFSYGGGRHTSSHGGTYSGGAGSSHRGGHYSGPQGGYGTHR